MPNARITKKKAAKKAKKAAARAPHVPAMSADDAELAFYTFADECSRIFRFPQPPGTCDHYAGMAQAEAYRKRVQADFARYCPDKKMPSDEPTHEVVRDLYGDMSHMLVACNFYEYHTGKLPQCDIFLAIASQANWAFTVSQVMNSPKDENGDIVVNLMNLKLAC